MLGNTKKGCFGSMCMLREPDHDVCFCLFVIYSLRLWNPNVQFPNGFAMDCNNASNRKENWTPPWCQNGKVSDRQGRSGNEL